MRVRLPARFNESLAVACAVAIGAALITLCLVVGETGWRAPPPAERLAGIDLVVGGEQQVRQDEDFDVALPEQVGVPADLVGRIAEVEGVAGAAGDLSFPAVVADGAGGFQAVESPRHNGHGWDSLLEGASLTGSPPADSGEVVLTESAASEAGVSVGDDVRVALAGDARTVEVSGLVALPGGGVFVREDVARSLSQQPTGTVDLITVRVAEGADVGHVADRLEALVGAGGVVSSGDEIGAAERPDRSVAAGEVLAMAVSLGGVVVILVGFITTGAVSVIVTNRSRELALLRAVGALPAQVRSIVARQVTRIGMFAAAVGILGGYLTAGWVQGPLHDSGLLAPGQSLSWSPAPAGATLLLMLGTVQLAARAGAWRMSRLNATAAVVATETEPRGGGVARTWFGIVVLVLALAGAVVPLLIRSEEALIGAASGTLLAVIGLALVAPAVVQRVTGSLAGRARRVNDWLAVRNSGSYALRTGGAISVLALAVGLTLTQVFSTTTVSAVAEHEVRAGTLAQARVAADPLGGVSERLAAEIADLPSASTAVPLAQTTAVRTYQQDGQTSAEAYPMLAVGSGADRVLDLDVVDGDLSELAGNTVAVDSGTAWLAGVGVGDTLPLTLADGTSVEPVVVATYRYGFGFGKIVAPLDLVPGAVPFDAVLVGTADPGGLDEELAALAAGQPGLSVTDPQLAAADAGVDPYTWINLGVSALLVGYVLIGLANRLVATTMRRRREWQLLRALGATPRQLLAMARAEVALVCAGAVGAGVMLSLGPMTAVALGFIGRPWPQGPWWTVVVTVTAVCLAAYAATMLPARHLLRRMGPPVPAG